MKNFIQNGNNLTLAAPYAVNSGEGVLVDRVFGVACSDADNGADVDIATVGVFALAKETTDVFTLGQPVYFDTATLTVRSHTDPDSNSAGESEALVGVAVAVAGVGTSTVRVKLAPSPVTLV